MECFDLGLASLTHVGDRLRVTTGVVEREWRLLSSGWQTVRLGFDGDAQSWVRPVAGVPDWRFISYVEPDDTIELLGVEATPVENVSFTSDHLKVVSTFHCPKPDMLLKHVVWLYPGSNGIRTQLLVRGLRDFERAELRNFLGPSYGERFCLVDPEPEVFAAGYYNDTQHRNYPETPILREQVVSRGAHGKAIIDWANLVQVSTSGGVLSVVKESHKCVNQPGVNTGSFVFDGPELRVTGLGLTSCSYKGSPWLQKDRERECWANWVILTDGDCSVARVDIKRFDRKRFPFRPKRDTYVMANTWGTRGEDNLSRAAAAEGNVLSELESCADIGVDILQIDDGWQFNLVPNWNEIDWRPKDDRFPGGWESVKQRAAELGVSLGLWMPWTVAAEDMIRNQREGSFRRFKLDFAVLDSRDAIEELCEKARLLVENTDRNVGINWDLTEEEPRMGYYYARDYGSLFLANRPAPPPEILRMWHTTYTPWLTLREVWHLSRYMNLNQIQISIQNVDRIAPEHSDAALHNHDYCFAIAMMGLPLFFQETQFYTEAAREQLRPLVATYKEHRDEMLKGYVSPIGEEPNNASWAGFINTVDDSSGYLCIFRERQNQEDTASLALPLPPRTRIKLEDVVAKRSTRAELDELGEIEFTISLPGSYLFMRYEVL